MTSLETFKKDYKINLMTTVGLDIKTIEEIIYCLFLGLQGFVTLLKNKIIVSF